MHYLEKSRTIGLFLALSLFCFTSVKTIEIIDPIEEVDLEKSHPSHDWNNLFLFCGLTEEHHPNCLHQNGLSPQANHPFLIAQMGACTLIYPPFKKQGFLSDKDFRIRGSPRKLSI